MARIATTAAWILAFGLIVAGCAKFMPVQKPPSKEQAVDHFVKGQILIETGDPEAALAELERAVEIDPELSIAHATIGDVYRRQGQWEHARRAYEEACRTNPFAFKAHYNLGVTYQALAAATEAVEKVSEYLEKAVEVYLRAIMLAPGDFDSHLNISVCYYQLGYIVEAERYCRMAVELDPTSALAYCNLGAIMEAQGDLDEAIQAYKASLEQDPDQPDLLMCLGLAYMRQKRWQPAIQTFTELTTLNPTDARPWEKIGACHFYLRDFAASESAYSHALSLDLDSAAAHRGMGVAYIAQYIVDRTLTDLRDKGLEEWYTSLSLQPDQDDLIPLVRKYARERAADEEASKLQARNTSP